MIILDSETVLSLGPKKGQIRSSIVFGADLKVE
jgi:hypothetical protein